MRCISCGSFCFAFLCKDCKSSLRPRLNKRELEGDLFVYSFFGYEDISALLHTKHHHCGMYVYKFLASISIKPFLKDVHQDVYLLPIDDKPKGGYSHTAVLARSIKQDNVKVLHHSLRARSKLSYSGKSLSYRKKNPRDFVFSGKSDRDVILLDDLVTTGTTLLEAYKILKKSHINVLFALTLADAKVK